MMKHLFAKSNNDSWLRRIGGASGAMIPCLVLGISLGANVAQADLPDGISRMSAYEVRVTKLTDAAVSFLNEGDFKKESFRVRLERSIDADDLQALAKMPWIRTLVLPAIENPPDSAFLKPLVELRQIQFRGLNLPDYSALAELPELREVDFQGGTMQRIDWVAKLPKLEDLNLHQVATIEDYGPLAGLKQLKKLSLAGHKKGPEVLAPVVSTLANLEVISLAFYPGEDLDMIKNCSELREVDCIFSRNLVEISALRNLQKLERLNLWGTKVEDLSALAACKNLKVLNLTDTPAGDLSPLYGCSELLSLTVHEDFPAQAIEDLKKRLPDLRVSQ